MWIAVSFVAELEPLVVIPCPAINHLNGQANTQHLPILSLYSCLYFSLPPRFLYHISYSPVFRLRGLKYLRFFSAYPPLAKTLLFQYGIFEIPRRKKISCRIPSSRSTSESERISGWSGRGSKVHWALSRLLLPIKRVRYWFFSSIFYLAHRSLRLGNLHPKGLNRNWSKL